MTSNQPKVGSVGGVTHLDREEEAELALKNTVLTRPMALCLCIFFLLTIYAVPAIQQGLETHQNLAARNSNGGEGRILPQAFDVFNLGPGKPQVMAARSLADAWALIPPVSGIKDFENTLEQQSFLSQKLLPHAQSLLTGWLGAGNEQAYTGRNGWLFYRPDVDSLTGPPFLDAAVMQNRARSGDASSTPVQPDPVKAIVRFKEQLASRGIALVVLPMPVKPVVDPEELSGRYSEGQHPVLNPSYESFRQSLESQGIPVFDVSSLLVSARQQTHTPQYLETDTHWTPSAMELSAQQLAKYIQQRMNLPPLPAVGYTRRRQSITNLGDIAVMLKLPQAQHLYGNQSVSIDPVYTPNGQLWAPRRDADILLLGDSFSNIYSLSGMDWGEGAGFAQQLSYYLQRPLDRIVINAGGAYTSRQELARELTRGRNRLAGRRLVIYEFAMRDLSFGDWKLLDLPQPRK